MAAGGQTHGSVLLNLKQAMAPEHEAQPEAEAAADRAHKAHVPYEQVMEYAGHSQSVSSVEFSKGMDGGRLIASGCEPQGAEAASLGLPRLHAVPSRLAAP